MTAPIASGLMGWDWGTVPAWVSTTSVVLAAWAFWRGTRDKRREQASKVAAWVELREENGKNQFYLHVRNDSTSPIFHLTIHTESDRYEQSELEPGASFKREVSPGIGYQRMLTKIDAIKGGRDEKITNRQIKRAFKDAAVSLHFRDSLGRWWKRKANGKIKGSKRGKWTSSELEALGIRQTWDDGWSREP
ncbi:hypothetical protein [Streptomyces sp. NPDC059411]|uniref:hypothetical protein n=1 Tax=Streptomyces sp. NPDC059411 TaxID=3346825 RepID=UPI0036754D84